MYISVGDVNPPGNSPRCTAGMIPRQAYKGTMDAIVTSTTSVWRVDRRKARWIHVHMSEPAMPEMGASAVTMMSAVAVMCRLVLAKRIAVLVIVENAVQKNR